MSPVLAVFSGILKLNYCLKMKMLSWEIDKVHVKLIEQYVHLGLFICKSNM